MSSEVREARACDGVGGGGTIVSVMGKRKREMDYERYLDTTQRCAFFFYPSVPFPLSYLF